MGKEEQIVEDMAGGGGGGQWQTGVFRMADATSCSQLIIMG